MATVTYGYATTTAEFTVDAMYGEGDQSNPDIAVYGAGHFSIAYTTQNPASGLDFAIRNFDSKGGVGGGGLTNIPPGAESGLVIATLSSFGQITAGVRDAAPGGVGGTSVVWGGSGLPNNAAPNIAGNQSDNQFTPDVAGLTGDRKVIVWADEASGSMTDIDIRLSVFNNEGTITVKDAVLVTGAVGVQRDPSVAALSTGGFVVTWSDDGMDGSKTRIMGQRYSADGDKVGGLITIDNVGDNDGSKVIGLNDGGFAVAYEDSQHGLTKDISLRFFNADGTARTDAILVNQTTQFTDSEPTLTKLANGMVVVSWTHNAAAGNDDLYLRAFSPNSGAPITDEFRYQGASGSFNESQSAIESTPDGGMVLAWNDSEVTDAGGTHIGASIMALQRTSNGDESGELVMTDNLQDVINGFGGNDFIGSYGGADTVNGGAGDDFIEGGAHADLIDGGIGSDFASYLDKSAPVVITLKGASDAMVKVSGVDEDTLRNIENLVGGSGVDVLTGDGLVNTLRGAGGKDVLDGAGGLDTADYSDKGVTVTVFLDGANDVAVTVMGVDEDTIRNFENVIGGGEDDTLVGDSLNNILSGGGGRDYLHAHSYNAEGTMKAGAGANTLNGEVGDDGLFGGDGIDTLNGGVGNDGLVGGGGNDILNGDSGVDFLFGGAFGAGGAKLANSGADTLHGGGDKDGLYGFDGADFLFGDAGDDYVEGGAGGDTLNGGAGADFLLGQEGADMITGAAGFDYMYGGTDADTFVFKKGDSADWILDFKAAEGDKLKFEGFGYASFAAIPLVDLSTPGNPAVQLTFSDGVNVDQLTIFGVTLAQLNAGNVLLG